MNNTLQPKLDLIRNKHLQDPVSDSLYQPFRDVSYQVLINRTQSVYQQKDKFFERLNDSKIPYNLKALQISQQPINPLKKMIKIGQRQKQYPAIQEKVLEKMLRNNRKTEIITYKYGASLQKSNIHTLNDKKIRCLTLQRRGQNQSNFKQRLQKLNNIKKVQNSKYNLYSIADYPVNSIIKGSIFSCGDCSNQIIARERQLIWQEK